MLKFLLTTLLFGLLFSCSEPAPEVDPFDKILWTADWSPDGQYIVVGGNSGDLNFISGDDYSITKSVPVPQTVTNTSWYNDGKNVLVSFQMTDEGSFSFNIDTEKKTRIDSLPSTGNRAVGWNYDHSLYAIGDNEGMLSIYDSDGQLMNKFEGDPKSITGLDWHPTENIISMVGSRLGIYDMESDSFNVITPRDQEVLMLCVDWHPSGDFFVTGDYGDYEIGLPSLLQFWDPAGSKIKEVKGMKSEIRNIKWSKNGEQLAVASNMAYIYDYNATMIRQNDLGSQLWGIDWDPNDSRLVTTTENGSVYVLSDKLKVVKMIAL
ncbi:MAG: WD40 repeat domain-containing protein [Saprospiraceae bacterium]|nr:WD40 repeat domain-containing protein [Saprospiraceae bacterium]